MAKARNRGTRPAPQSQQADRDEPLPSLAPLALPSMPPRSVRDLLAVEDRRTFTPDPLYRHPRMTSSRPARLTLPPAPAAKQVRPGARLRAPSPYALNSLHRLEFAAPKHTLICVRRKTRREVLHALKRTGRGPSRKSRNAWSNINCR